MFMLSCIWYYLKGEKNLRRDQIRQLPKNTIPGQVPGKEQVVKNEKDGLFTAIMENNNKKLMPRTEKLGSAKRFVTTLGLDKNLFEPGA